jgi:cytochrome c5
LLAAGSVFAADGQAVYDQACMACHAQGVAGAPKFGDAEAWAARIAKGKDTLYENSINGFQGEAGVMPPKGGFMNFSDEEVKAAVDYMVENAQ